MKGIVISAPSSGSGKTLFTMGLIKVLKNLNYSIFPCKVGPDYIDTAFLGRVADFEGQNLDKFLQGNRFKQVFDFSRDLCVIEGVMGYFDGIQNTFENSTFQIAEELNLNTILVYTPKGEMFSAVPKIKGMVEFSNGNIKGIVLNKVSYGYYKLLKEAIEKYINIKVLGFIEEDDDLEIKSRHLGLIQNFEIEDLEIIVEKMAEKIRNNVDLSGLISLFKEINISCANLLRLEKTNLKAAVAYDKAFSFYYRENLEILRSIFDVEFFSPIKDKRLPACDLLYIGGGYPEVFKEELSNNTAMLNSVREFVESGGYVFAECGGLMYLTREIDGYKMAGVFPGKSKMTEKLQNFGYVEAEILEDCLIGEKGQGFKAHEFHKSVADIFGQKYLKVKKAKGDRITYCGYQYKNAFGMYPHVSFLGSLTIIENILKNLRGE